MLPAAKPTNGASRLSRRAAFLPSPGTATCSVSDLVGIIPYFAEPGFPESQTEYSEEIFGIGALPAIYQLSKLILCNSSADSVSTLNRRFPASFAQTALNEYFVNGSRPVILAENFFLASSTVTLPAKGIQVLEPVLRYSKLSPAGASSCLYSPERSANIAQTSAVFNSASAEVKSRL